MLSVKDVAVVYETLLASPGMNDSIKISLHLPRKQVLLLSRLIEIGLQFRNDDPKGSMLSVIEESELEQLQVFSNELLKKAGLTEMNDKINSLITK